MLREKLDDFLDWVDMKVIEDIPDKLEKFNAWTYKYGWIVQTAVGLLSLTMSLIALKRTG